MNIHYAPRRSPSPQNGSVLLAAIMFVAVMSLIIGSVLTWSVTERRINKRHAMRIEAKNLAEAAAEYGFAQVRHRMDHQTSFTSNALDPEGDGALIQVPSSILSSSKAISDSVELTAGVVKTTTNNNSDITFYVDPADPNNQFDPMRGKHIFRRDVQILAKATVRDPSISAPITAYASQTLAMREAPLFAHALFYNMDLELAPGADFTIIGPVHTNGNLWVVGQANNSSNTDFRGSVTAAGGVYWGYKTTPIMGTGTLEPTTQEAIRFRTKAGDMVSLRSSSGVWRDHTMGYPSVSPETVDEFRSFASNTYSGNLLTSAHGIENYKPVAFSDYLEDPTPNNGVDNSNNSGRAIIERPLLSSDAGFNSEVENQKLSRKSGLYIAVNPSNVARVAKKPNGTTISIPAGQYRAFKQDGTEVLLPGSTVATAGTNHPNPGGRPVIQIKPDQMTDLRRYDKFKYNSARSSSNKYDPLKIDIIEFDMTAFKMAVDYTVNGKTSSRIYDYNGSSDSTYRSTGTTNKSLSEANRISGFSSSDWNGAVYVESVDAETRRDSGVRIINARGSVAGKPANSVNEGLSLTTNDAMYILGHFNADGSVNTDATSSSNSSRYSDDGNEIPAALAADAITILSQPTFNSSGVQTGGWNDAYSDLTHTSSGWSSSWATSKPSTSNRYEGNSDYRKLSDSGNPLSNSYTAGTSSNARTKLVAQDTEISAALLTGIVPSNKDGSNQNSGGAHNFPRLLESWGSNRLVIRGSMVALFESRVGTEPWSIRYYNAPGRFWGFHDMFAQGRYPPQTPRVRTYRRVDFRDLTATEYDTLRAALPW